MKMKKLLVYGGLAAGVYWLGRSMFRPSLGGLGDGAITIPPGVSPANPNTPKVGDKAFGTEGAPTWASPVVPTPPAPKKLTAYLPAALGIGLGAVLLYVLLRKKRA